jgi:hypothetical protein
MTSGLTLALRARNAKRAKSRYQICLIHPFDPRGEKVGGLDALAQRFIDVRDAIEVGEMVPATIAGVIADFTPGRQLARVFRYHQEIQNARGTTITPSEVTP